MKNELQRVGYEPLIYETDALAVTDTANYYI